MLVYFIIKFDSFDLNLTSINRIPQFIEPKLEYQTHLTGDHLLVEHPEYTHEIIYDLCDLQGRIYLSGELAKRKEETDIDLKKVPEGDYHLFIINEGMVYKKLLSFRN